MSNEMKQTKRRKRSSHLANMGAALLSATAAFVGWGYLSGVAGASPSPTPSSVSHDREAVLNEAKKAKKHDEKNATVILNDPFMQNKWGLERTSAAKAWEITKGSKDIVVAVIDTGIDVNHADISDNLWKNPGETGVVENDFCKKQRNPLSLKECDKSRNDVDDDGNGYKDDVYGWNFVYNDNKLTDNHGHGTHIAGIIAANGMHNGRNTGVSGVAPNVSVMILKYYDPKASNSNNLKNTVNAIRYAIKMKAQIINYSGGGTDYSAEEYAAVKEAERAGILFIAAAGNERSNSDEAGKHYYPADYGLSNIISVTAVNKEETKVLPSSNYGVRTVDLAAPGENIYSTLPNQGYGFMTGTSQATAFVTGVAALIMSHNRDFSSADVKKYILRTGDEYATLLSKTGTAKLLNSFKALASLDIGVGLTGVVASNTAKIGTRTFSSDQNPKNARLNNVSALNETADENSAPAEEIALFGREFMKALEKAPAAAPEIRRR